MSTITFHSDITPLEALWTLYQTQSKRVRKEFRMRVMLEYASEKKAEEMRIYEQQLPDDVRESVCRMAVSVKKSAEEVRQASLKNTHVGRRAEDFLAELESE